MKKSTLTLTLALSACALTTKAQQNLTESKLTDNWFIGISGGVYEPTAGSSFFGDMRPAIKLEIGRYLTPVSVCLQVYKQVSMIIMATTVLIYFQATKAEMQPLTIRMRD